MNIDNINSATSWTLSIAYPKQPNYKPIVVLKPIVMSTTEFNTQVIGYSKQLKYFALNLTADYEEAQDLLQETLLKAIKHSHKFTAATNLKAWLYTIMKNIFINNYRKAVKTRTVIDRTKELHYLNVPQAAGPRVTESHMNELEIRKAICHLEEEYKIPFEMYIDGFKYKEIAEHLDLPIGTIKSRIFLARQELMQALKDFKR
jgi:RNA polymerase sigma-70 factor (ECF subfamily)